MNLFACRKVGGQRRVFSRPTRAVAAGTAMTLLSFIGLTTTAPGASAAQAPVGAGFTITPSDLAFILKQIKIAEAHVANTTSATGPCGALIGTGPNQIPSPLVSQGLRTVDGSCNNLQPGQETFGAADQTFPRLATPVVQGRRGCTRWLRPGRLDELRAEEGQRFRLRAPHHQQPDRRSDLHQPGRRGSGRQPGQDAGQRGRRAVHDGSAAQRHAAGR